MADQLPLKLKSLGGGLGALSEFETGDQIPQALINGLVDALAGKLAITEKAYDSARLGGALASTFLQLGDAGIGKNSTPSLADLNSVTITGFNNYGAAAANKPPSTATSTGGVVQTIYFNATNAVQIAWPYGTAEQWVRTMVGGVWGGWPRVFTTANILGTVSQSGGVPTGAIIQSGLGANGWVIRYADGTQICWNKLVGNLTTQPMIGFGLNPTFASPFTGELFVKYAGLFFESANQTGSVLYATITDYANSGAVMVNTGQRASNVLPSFTPGSTVAQSYVWSFFAIGRWF